MASSKNAGFASPHFRVPLADLRVVHAVDARYFQFVGVRGTGRCWAAIRREWFCMWHDLLKIGLLICLAVILTNTEVITLVNQPLIQIVSWLCKAQLLVTTDEHGDPRPRTPRLR